MLLQVLFAPRNSRRSEKNEPRSRGSIAIITALAFLPMSLILAVVVDSGRSWVVRERLQNGVEASAVSVAQTWMVTGTSCESSALQIASADGAAPSNLVCTTTGTNRGGVVSVSADENVKPIFSNLLGRDLVRISTTTKVRIGIASRAGNLRPIALCADNSNLQDWIRSGMKPDVTVRVPFLSPSTLCGGDVSGNWTVLDFNGGSSSNNETQDWISKGYDQLVTVGDVLYGSPGVPATSLKFNVIVGQVITFPIFSTPISQGSNAKYTIVGFARAKIVSAQLSGPQDSRGMTMQFLQGALSGSIGGNTSADFGLTAWSVCSYESTGDCS